MQTPKTPSNHMRAGSKDPAGAREEWQGSTHVRLAELLPTGTYHNFADICAEHKNVIRQGGGFKVPCAELRM